MTVSVSLDEKYVQVLDSLAKEAGSRSAAIRRLLDEHERARQEREMEEAYREYFADPANVERERQLTEEMLSIAAWPREWYAKRGKKRGAKKSRSPRSGVRR